MLQIDNLVKNIKQAISQAGDDEILDLSRNLTEIGVNPETGEVLLDQNLLEGGFKYTSHLRGVRPVRFFDSLDGDLCDLPVNFLDELEDAIDESENQGLVETKATIQKLVKLGLAIKAAETRQRILNADLAEAVAIALERLKS